MINVPNFEYKTQYEAEIKDEINISATTIDDVLNSISTADKIFKVVQLDGLIAKLKEYTKKAEDIQEEAFKNIALEFPCEIDEEGKLLNTQIYNKETGEVIDVLEWKQDKKALLDEEKAVETLKEIGIEADKYLFYELQPNSKKVIQQKLRILGLSGEAIESCFTKIERKEPKIVFKGTNNLI